MANHNNNLNGKGDVKMIVYDKLANILNERNMMWKDLCKSGISINMPTKFAQNRLVSVDTIDKVCEYLGVQPGDIMEWITQEEYDRRTDEKTIAEKLAIEAQIAELQEKLKKYK